MSIVGCQLDFVLVESRGITPGNRNSLFLAFTLPTLPASVFDIPLAKPNIPADRAASRGMPTLEASATKPPPDTQLFLFISSS
ncbi:MAG TPA: hypothetical protein VL096_16560, partial [Pirellulaceae bacterium]|nr:hypothetical protein [Pirellulaceae bacterium]